MTAPAWVLDTGALMAYVHQVERIGEIVVDASDAASVVALPLVCVVEAYSLLEPAEHDLLRLLRRNPATRTYRPNHDVDVHDDCPVIGGMARRTGRLGAAHAAFLALTSAAAVVTSRPDQIHAVLGSQWPVVEVR